MRRLLMFCIGLLATACTSAVVSNPATPTPPLPTLPAGAIRLRVGESATMTGGKVVTFVGVPEDSRCPQDVQCVWSGMAIVELSFGAEGAVSETLRLEFLGGLPNYVEFTGMSIAVIDLLPDPISTREINPLDYIVTLDITTP